MSDTYKRALETADTNPDEAAQQQSVAERLGVGRIAIVAEPRLAQEDAARGVAEKLADSPVAERFYNNNAEIVGDDDVDGVKNTVGVVEAAGQTFSNIGRSWRLSNLEVDSFTKGPGNDTDFDKLQRRILQEEMKAEPGLAGFEFASLPDPDSRWWIAGKSAQDAVQLFGQGAESLGQMVESVVTAAATPFVGPAAPAAGVTVASLREGGGLYRSLIDNHQIPEDVAGMVAVTAAPFFGAIEYGSAVFAGGKFLPGKVAAKQALRRVIGAAVSSKGFGAALKRVAAGSVVEGLEEGAAAGLSDLGLMSAQALNGQEPEVRVTVDGEEFTGWAAVLLNALAGAKVGFFAGATFGAAGEAKGAVASLLGGAQRQDEDRARRDMVSGLIKEADASKVRERAPDRHAELVEEAIVEHGAADTVLVPAEKFKELLQEASPEDVAELEAAAPGIVEKAKVGAETGADVSVPISSFVSRVIHTKLGQELRKSWRTDPDSMTEEQEAAEEERLVAEGTEAVAEETAPDPLVAYQQARERSLVEAGTSVQEARQVATGEVHNVRMYMDETGKTLEQLAEEQFGIAPEVVAGEKVRAEEAGLRQRRAEEAGRLDTRVLRAKIADVRRPEIEAPSDVELPEPVRVKREARAAFRQEVEEMGLSLEEDTDDDIVAAFEARAADDFAAAADVAELTELFQKARPIERRGVAKWLRDTEKEGNRGMARRIVEHFRKAPPTSEIVAAAKAGVAKRGWYRRSTAAIQHVFGQDAARFTALLAALSPQDSVENNLRNALRVWRTWTSKEFNRTQDPKKIAEILKRDTVTKEDKEALQARVNNSVAALTASEEVINDLSQFSLSGNKVDSFWRNLMGDMEAVTLDAWMATFFGLPGKNFSDSKYRALSAAVRKAAQELSVATGEHWTPAEVQETIWSWAKALVEQADSPEERRTALEIIQANGLDPKRVKGVPDFAGLLSRAVYAPLIEEMNLGGRVREAGERGVEGPGDGAEAAAPAAGELAAGEAGNVERAARRVARTVAARRAAGGRELKQRVGVEAPVERLRGLGLRVEKAEDGSLLFVGHDGRKFSVEQLDTPDGMRAFHEALGFPTAEDGRDTIADLKVYRLNIPEARLQEWLTRIGWTFKRFGPGTGPNGKPFWPNFRDPATPTYKDKVVWIFSEQVPEGSFFDPPYTLAWRVPHEVAHGLVNDELTRRYGPGFRAGALGKVVRGPFFREEQMRTLNDALRATDWEIETFRAQRAILEREFGVDLTEEEFRKENAVNYAGALYRAITGQFADPNTVSILPAALDPEALQTLGHALLEAVAEERGAELGDLESRAMDEALEAQKLAKAGIPGLVGGRGRFQYRTNDYQDLSKARIILERSQNASTALHEFWHLWWARLEKHAKSQLREGATTQEIRAQARAAVMWDKARKYVGAAAGQELTDHQREKLARSGEAFLREGKAPVASLREMFDSFRTWLRRLYVTLLQLEKDAGQPIRLTDDIRQVMSQMFATDAQLAAAKKARGFTPANEAAIVSLMSDDEREKYEKLIADADSKARARVAQKIHSVAKARKRATWEQAVEELKTDVEASVRGRLAVAARHWLATGEWQAMGRAAPEIENLGLDSTAVREMYGKRPVGLPSEIFQDGGHHPDVAAEALGFTDGESLIRALEALGKEATEKIVERELKARVQAELGEAEAFGRDEIVFAMAELSEYLDGVGIAERALARKAGAKAVSRSTVRAAARRIVAATPVHQLNPNKYRVAAAREGEAAVKHAGSGAYGEAVAAKRRQLLNVFLEAEAIKAKEQAAKNHDRLDFLQGPVADATLVRAGHTYKDQIDQLLERFNLRRATGKEIARRQSLAEWVAKQEADGETPAIPDHLRDEAYTKNWRELTVSELQDITDAADSIYHLARRKVEFSAAAKKRDRAEARTELIGRLERVTKLPPAQRYVDYDDPKKRTIGKKIFSLQSAIDKIVTIVDHLDGGDTSGAWHTLVYRPIAEALGRKQDMAREYAEKYHDLLKALVKGREKQYHARITTDLAYPDEHGRPALGRFTKLQLLGIASNLGNDSNMKKLLEGYGWTEAQVTAELQKHLTKADWDFVQKTWKLIDTLWPAIEEQERKLNGVVPQRVIPRQFTVLTADGKTVTLSGGYFPVVYDPDPSKTNWAHKNASRGVFEGVENHFMRAITGHGHTKSRTEVTGPLLFDAAIVPRHLDEVIHDLAFRAVLMDVDALLDDKDVKGALQRALGDQYAQIFRPWLQSIAQDRVFEPQLMRPWAKMLRRIRTNATGAVLFFRDSTLLAQLSGHANAIAEMRAHLPDGWASDYMQALRVAAHGNAMGVAKGVNEAAQFVMARSAFMRSRTDNADRDRRDQVRQMQGEALPTNVLLKKAIAAGGALIANTQFYGVDVPVWLAAFNAAQRLQGKSEADAAFVADQIVRLSQGSGESIDLSEMQRGPEWQKMFTSFYSYVASQYAAFVRDTRALRVGRISFGEFAVRFGLRYTLPALYMTAVRALLPGGDEPPDLGDDEWWDEAQWAFANSGFYELTGGVPILRDIVGWVRYGRVSSSIPVSRVAQEAIDLTQEVKRAATGDVRPVELTVDALNAIAMVTGLPVVRAADLVKELNEWWEEQ